MGLEERYALHLYSTMPSLIKGHRTRMPDYCHSIPHLNISIAIITA